MKQSYNLLAFALDLPMIQKNKQKKKIKTKLHVRFKTWSELDFYSDSLVWCVWSLCVGVSAGPGHKLQCDGAPPPAVPGLALPCLAFGMLGAVLAPCLLSNQHNLLFQMNIDAQRWVD